MCGMAGWLGLVLGEYPAQLVVGYSIGESEQRRFRSRLQWELHPKGIVVAILVLAPEPKRELPLRCVIATLGGGHDKPHFIIRVDHSPRHRSRPRSVITKEAGRILCLYGGRSRELDTQHGQILNPIHVAELRQDLGHHANSGTGRCGCCEHSLRAPRHMME